MNARMYLSVLWLCLAGVAAGFTEGNRICLDPGHGGSDPGTPGPNGLIDEKDVNLNVALALKDTIEWFGGFFDVGLTRETDIYVGRTSRAIFANEAFNGEGYDYFISIHHNSADTCPLTQGTEVFHCLSATVHGTGEERAVDTMMAWKICLRVWQQWPDRNMRGLKHSCDFTVLNRTKMISCIVEASFLCDPYEEALFDFRPSGHTEEEASAIFQGFMSYCDNAGIAKISNSFLGGPGWVVDVDNAVHDSPVEFNWSVMENHWLEAWYGFSLGGYDYFFHHWAHLDPLYLDPTEEYPDRVWPIVVPFEEGYHIYRAYFTGGRYDVTLDHLPSWHWTAGDTLAIYWNCDPGIDSTSIVDLYLDRQAGNGGYPELIASGIEYDPEYQLFNWIVTGPSADSCMLKIMAHDTLGNQTVGYLDEWDIFAVCDWLIGDADGNGAWEVTDAIYLLDYVMTPGSPAPTPHPIGSGDCDCNGAIEMTDAVYLIALIFVPGAPEPGDPNNDGVPDCTCADYN